MTVSPGERILSLQPPKTAATSITRWMIENAAGVHVHSHMIHVPKHYEGFMKFVVMRNPYDRAVSAYHYCCFSVDKKTGKPRFPALRKRISEKISLIQWLKFVENLEEEFRKLPFKSDAPLEKLNTTDHLPWEEEVGPQEIAVINRLYSDDFWWGGYEKIVV